MYQYYTKEIKKPSDLEPNEIFVFGSNLAGRHGAGAAKFARDYLGAEYKVGAGFTGQCYAIPTKDHNIEVLSLDIIECYVGLFQTFANIATIEGNTIFFITKVGCGLAGYKDSEIAPLFKGSPNNCKFHLDWKEFLE